MTEGGQENTKKETVIVDKNDTENQLTNITPKGSIHSINTLNSGVMTNGSIPITHNKRQKVSSNGSFVKSDEIEMQNIDAGKSTATTKEERVRI